MSVFDNFASNLRLLCKSRGTVVQVAGELGINRQQFSKYLSGDTFPRRETFEKICRYFDVDETQIFLNPEQYSYLINPAHSELMENPVFSEILDSLHQNQDMPISQGYYLTYIKPVPSTGNGYVVRSITSIQQVGKTTQFRRLTGFGEKLNSHWRASRGNHRGVVLNRLGCFFFIAFDKVRPRTPTLSIMQWSLEASDREILKGKCLTLTKSGPNICDIVMVPMPPNLSLRRALRETWTIGWKESALPAYVRLIFLNMMR